MPYIPDLHDYSAELPKEAEPAISDERKIRLKAEIEQLIDDEFERLRNHAAEHISAVAAERAAKFLQKVLYGYENAAMQLFGDSDGSSRFRSTGHDAGKPWASVIHGKIFETGGITLRRKIVEAHADLLRNERIKDLESVVEGLRMQVVQLEREKESLLERCR